jgi:hypothetical protein
MKMNMKIKLVTLGSRAFSTDRDNSNTLNPAVVYENVDTQKELILKDNQRKAGVYR